MNLKEIIKQKPHWVESITCKTPSTEMEITPVVTITCIGRITSITDLEELVLDCNNCTDSKITVIVTWRNFT